MIIFYFYTGFAIVKYLTNILYGLDLNPFRWGSMEISNYLTSVVEDGTIAYIIYLIIAR